MPAKVERLLEPVMEDGLPVGPPRGVGEARTHMRERIGSFDSTYLRLLNPHLYKVSISTKLRDSKLSYIKKYFRNREAMAYLRVPAPRRIFHVEGLAARF